MRKFLTVWSSLDNRNVCVFYLYQLPLPANQEESKDNSVIAQYQISNNKVQQKFKEKSIHLKQTFFCKIPVQLDHKIFFLKISYYNNLIILQMKVRKVK